MTNPVFKFPKTFIASKKETHISIALLKKADYKDWLKSLDKPCQEQAKASGFAAGAGAFIEYGAKGQIKEITLGIADDFNLYDAAKAADVLRSKIAKDIIKTASFSIKTKGLKAREMEQALIGVALSNYVFDTYKSSSKSVLKFVVPKSVDTAWIKAYTEAAFTARNLINIPANDMGPDEIEEAARQIAESHKASVKVIKGASLEKNYPLIHTVGKASPRAPRLIDGDLAADSFWNNIGDTWFEGHLESETLIRCVDVAIPPDRQYQLEIEVDGVSVGKLIAEKTLGLKDVKEIFGGVEFKKETS